MLIESMFSDDGGHFSGRIEGGNEVPLSVPYPCVVVGKGGSTEMEKEREKLKYVARINEGRYFLIGGESVYNEGLGVWRIPYIVFTK